MSGEEHQYGLQQTVCTLAGEKTTSARSLIPQVREKPLGGEASPPTTGVR